MTQMTLTKPVRFALGALAALVVAVGVIAITAYASGLRLTNASRGPTVTAAAPSPAPTASAAVSPTPKQDAAVLRAALMAAEAQVLGLTPGELRDALALGKTLHQLSDSKGISPDGFRSKLLENLKPLLDKAVLAGNLSADREKAYLQRLQTGPVPGWDGAAKLKPAPSPSPSR